MSLLIVALNVCVSLIFFPVMKGLNKKMDGLFMAKDVIESRRNIAFEACLIKLKKIELCHMACQACSYKLAGKDESTKNSNKKLVTFLNSMRRPAENWPKEFKKARSYNSVLAYDKQFQAENLRLKGEAGYLSSSYKSLRHFFQSTFTHINWSHLMGNMFMFLLVSVWVEQKIGRMKTLGLFLAGSFVGLFLHVTLHPGTVIVGASAGVSALMGAFFAFFWRSEMRFLFMLPPVYFARLTLPAIWTFPFLYLASDLQALLMPKADGVAHWAHMGGILVGLGFGYWFSKEENLKAHQLYREEDLLEKKMLKADSAESLWRAFNTVMSWNCQNREAVRLYLTRAQTLGLMLKTQSQKNNLRDTFYYTSNYYFKKGTNEEIHSWLRLLPVNLKLHSCLKSVPLRRLLIFADEVALSGDNQLALRLYECALKMKPGLVARNKISTAIDTIHMLNEEIANERSLQTATPA